MRDPLHMDKKGVISRMDKEVSSFGWAGESLKTPTPNAHRFYSITGDRVTNLVR